MFFFFFFASDLLIDAIRPFSISDRKQDKTLRSALRFLENLSFSVLLSF